MDCDEAVAGTAPLFRQLLNASAEESATEVVRGLIQARGCVDYVMVGLSSPWGGSNSSRPDGWRLAALVFGHPVRFGQDDFYCFTVFTIFIDMFRSIL